MPCCLAPPALRGAARYAGSRAAHAERLPEPLEVAARQLRREGRVVLPGRVHLPAGREAPGQSQTPPSESRRRAARTPAATQHMPVHVHARERRQNTFVEPLEP